METEWELCKENFQPLKRGRDPEKLADVAPSPAVAKKTIEEQRRWALNPPACKSLDSWHHCEPVTSLRILQAVLAGNTRVLGGGPPGAVA